MLELSSQGVSPSLLLAYGNIFNHCFNGDAVKQKEKMEYGKECVNIHNFLEISGFAYSRL